MTLLDVAFLLAQQNPVIRSYHAPATEYWEQSVEFRCGPARLSINGYGAVRPSNRAVSIVVNGREATTKPALLLKRDLSKVRGTYRITARCDKRSDPVISLRLYYGEKGGNGTVSYKVGSASIRHGEVRAYGGLKDTNADTFWFR